MHTCSCFNGHLACISVKFAMDIPPKIDDVIKAFKDYHVKPKILVVILLQKKEVFDADYFDRPQPRLDCNIENGFSISVGRIREDESRLGDIKFVCLSHNTIIGAAGSSILNAELAIKKGYL